MASATYTLHINDINVILCNVAMTMEVVGEVTVLDPVPYVGVTSPVSFRDCIPCRLLRLLLYFPLLQTSPMLGIARINAFM